MFRGIVGEENGRLIVVMDSMSQIEQADRDRIVVAASNGGQESGRMAIATGCALAVMNDAGVGKDQAGIIGIIHMGRQVLPASRSVMTPPRSAMEWICGTTEQSRTSTAPLPPRG